MAPWPAPPEPQTPLSLLTFAVLDLETTGLSARGADRICEIAIVRARLGRPPEPWSSLVHPGRPIPAHIAAKTHIDDRLVTGAPAFAQLVPRVQERLAGTVLVAHNVPLSKSERGSRIAEQTTDATRAQSLPRSHFRVPTSGATAWRIWRPPWGCPAPVPCTARCRIA